MTGLRNFIGTIAAAISLTAVAQDIPAARDKESVLIFERNGCGTSFGLVDTLN